MSNNPVLPSTASIPPSAEYHVDPSGNDANPGSCELPFLTIQHAASLALPGNTITIHSGIYRERINPPRGGESDTRRIVYRAAPGESLEIKGSEVVKNWTHVQGEIWRTTLPNSFFGDFNPYSDVISGDWFTAKGRIHHTGAVYLDGLWLSEAASLEEVLRSTQPGLIWFAEVDDLQTTISARFGHANPNEKTVEINVRQSVFYPEKTGVNYLTVRGLTMRHAATPWAPPTAEQIGLIGTNWSKGWIIENNVVTHSMCCGITLGKYGDEWDNQSADTAEGYNETIARALLNGWNRENIGGHIVRNNTVAHCEQAGIVGSLGAIFSEISNNHIHDIWCKQQFQGAELAGIKIHAAIDTVIKGNRIHRAGRGLWLDWMAQGTRVTGNLFYDNSLDDLFLEVNHGPCLVDNNIFLSRLSVRDQSEGTAFVHNLFNGGFSITPQDRRTPYHFPHATGLLGIVDIKKLDNRFYHNIFIGAWLSDMPESRWQCFGLWGYDCTGSQLETGGNIYYSGARPSGQEKDATEMIGVDPRLEWNEKDGCVELRIALGAIPHNHKSYLVTTSLLGQAAIPGLPFVNPDGSPLTVDRDYFGNARNEPTPTPGPFEQDTSVAISQPLTLHRANPDKDPFFG